VREEHCKEWQKKLGNRFDLSSTVLENCPGSEVQNKPSWILSLVSEQHCWIQRVAEPWQTL